MMPSREAKRSYQALFTNCLEGVFSETHLGPRSDQGYAGYLREFSLVGATKGTLYERLTESLPNA